MNKQTIPITTKRDDAINRESNLRFNGVLIWVGTKPSILESQLIIAENEALEASNSGNVAKMQSAEDKIFEISRQMTTTNWGVSFSFPQQKLP
jgi:hypothetical protein